jgi:hypothetical protein
VNTLRFHLLVSLIVLLPFRGAMAHFPSCAGGIDAAKVHVSAKADHLTHADNPLKSHHVHAHDHAHANSSSVPQPDLDPPNKPHGQQGECSSCALSCASACAAMPSSFEVVVMQVPSQKISSFITFRVQFLSGGLERPPRSL